MKNLTKHLLLLIAIIPLIILLSSVFTEKSSAQTQQQITACTVSCMDTNTLKDIDITTGKCKKFNLNTDLPYGNIPCDNAYINCYSYCKNKLSSSPTPTPTSTPRSCRQILDSVTCEKNSDCLWTYDITDHGFCTTKASVPTPTRAPRLVWRRIASCHVPTATPTSASISPTTTATPTPPLSPAGLCEGSNGAQQFQCFPGGCPQSIGSICAPPNTPGYPVCRDRSQFCFITQLPTSTPVPTTPTPTPISNVCSPADCSSLCAPGFACLQDAGSPTKSCSCQSTTAPTPTSTPTPTPTATPTITPTSVPGSVQLALAITQQGLTGTPVNPSRSVTVVLKGADDQIVTKIGTADFSNGAFNGTVNLGVLPSGSYKLKVKVGNFLKSPVSNLSISAGTAASAQTTVVAGLTNQFNDNVDAISFYASGLRTCFGSTIGIKKCDDPQDVDLNGDGNVDVIDYQIYLKGIRNLVQGLPVL